MVDYLSRFPEVIKLRSTTSAPVKCYHEANLCKIWHSTSPRHWQCASVHLLRILRIGRKYNLSHITSSPYFTQSNGQVEHTIKTVKKLLAGSDNPHLTLLNYRSTPFPWCNLFHVNSWREGKLQHFCLKLRNIWIPNGHTWKFQCKRESFQGKAEKRV